MTTWPATSTVPRRAGPSVAPTSSVIRDEPLPLAAERTPIHDACGRAVHVHAALEADSSSVALPPAAATSNVAGESVNTHAAAACVTVAR